MNEADIGLALFLGGCLLWAIVWGLLALALHAYNRAHSRELGNYLGIGIFLGWACVLLVPIIALCALADEILNWLFNNPVLKTSERFRAYFDKHFPNRVGLFDDDKDDDDKDDDDEEQDVH